LKFTGNPCLSEKPDPSKVIITEKKRGQHSAATYDSKNIFACVGSIQDSTVLRSDSAHILALAGTAASWDRFFQVLLQSVQERLAGIFQA